MNNQLHIPVLLKEMLGNLQVTAGETYIDGTFGAGGYSRAILEEAPCRVVAFDRDPQVATLALELKKRFKDSFEFINQPFSQMESELNKLNLGKVNGIVLDLGVSSMQLDKPERGFSFNSEHKLDMRMDQSKGGSAYELVNGLSEKELARIIKDLGEESQAKQIAKKIVEVRSKQEIESAKQLSQIIGEVLGGKRGKKIDPATKTFQALRIFINQELEELKNALDSAKNLLVSGGRLIVVSFHSLEDSIVKSFLRAESGYNDSSYSRYSPPALNSKTKEFTITGKTKPSESEVENNPRSRSAIMRTAIKV